VTLPEGWAETTMGDIVEPIETADPTKKPDESFRYVDIGSIDNAALAIVDPKEIVGRDAPSRARRRIRTNDVLFSTVRPYLKNIARVPPELDGEFTSTGICVLRAAGDVDPGFIFRRVISQEFIDSMTLASDGTMYPAIADRDVFSANVALPPLAEQRRIVAKLDALTARLSRARAELDRVPVLSDQLVSSALTKAFAELDGAERVPLKRVTSKIGSGSTPRGGKDVYVADGVPFIRSQNVYFEGFQYDGLAGITDTAAKALAGVTVHDGDVLLNITGASIGRACIVPEDLVGARVNQHVAILRTTGELEPEYLLAFLRTPQVQNWVWNENYGVTRQALTKGMIEAIQVPLPSLENQRAICARLNAAFARAERLEAEAARARELLDRMEAAILARAFRGELVPQDPNDEPASVLLDRIRAQRAAAPKSGRRPRATADE
jgi:type I restriction enzyme S subunit